MSATCSDAEWPTDLSCAALLTTVSDALYVIGGKWRLPVIIALAHQHRRFNKLQQVVTGISARVLSHELKALELTGFVRRIVQGEASPVVVEYELTAYSHTLAPVVEALSAWGNQHRQQRRQPTAKAT